MKLQKGKLEHHCGVKGLFIPNSSLIMDAENWIPVFHLATHKKSSDGGEGDEVRMP